jgi:tRNA threonylcarbamoyladenosine biosynthesis protein TsaB
LNILAIDTSESRGSVCLLQDTAIGSSRSHETDADYSEWLLPAVEQVLRTAGVPMETVDLFAVATGPGSFTGLRVGLTTVKAWAEVYGKPVIGISRLEAMAHPQSLQNAFVSAFYDAQRGQVFGALYHLQTSRPHRLEDEMVVSPTGFLEWVARHTGHERVSWVSLDPELLTGLPGWQSRIERGDTMARCSPELAPAIARLASDRAETGSFTDPLELDANYVRRSDAEIFWKGR